MDLQHADLGEFAEDLFPFLGRKLAAATLQFHRIGAIGTLQRAAMRQFGEHRERNPEGFRRRAPALQHGEPVGGVASRYACICQRRAHDVFSRACVKNPLSAKSCSMAMTSVAIAPRSATYLAASRSTMSPTLRTPSQSLSTSPAISPGPRPRSGARMTQTWRGSANFSLACRGSTGRLPSLTLMLRLAIAV